MGLIVRERRIAGGAPCSERGLMRLGSLALKLAFRHVAVKGKFLGEIVMGPLLMEDVPETPKQLSHERPFHRMSMGVSFSAEIVSRGVDGVAVAESRPRAPAAYTCRWWASLLPAGMSMICIPSFHRHRRFRRRRVGQTNPSVGFTEMGASPEIRCTSITMSAPQ